MWFSGCYFYNKGFGLSFVFSVKDIVSSWRLIILEIFCSFWTNIYLTLKEYKKFVYCLTEVHLEVALNCQLVGKSSRSRETVY